MASSYKEEFLSYIKKNENVHHAFFKTLETFINTESMIVGSLEISPQQKKKNENNLDIEIVKFLIIEMNNNIYSIHTLLKGILFDKRIKNKFLKLFLKEALKYIHTPHNSFRFSFKIPFLYKGMEQETFSGFEKINEINKIYKINNRIYSEFLNKIDFEIILKNNHIIKIINNYDINAFIYLIMNELNYEILLKKSKEKISINSGLFYLKYKKDSPYFYFSLFSPYVSPISSEKFIKIFKLSKLVKGNKIILEENKKTQILNTLNSINQKFISAEKNQELLNNKYKNNSGIADFRKKLDKSKFQPPLVQFDMLASENNGDIFIHEITVHLFSPDLEINKIARKDNIVLTEICARNKIDDFRKINFSDIPNFEEKEDVDRVSQSLLSNIIPFLQEKIANKIGVVEIIKEVFPDLKNDDIVDFKLNVNNYKFFILTYLSILINPKTLYLEENRPEEKELNKTDLLKIDFSETEKSIESFNLRLRNYKNNIELKELFESCINKIRGNHTIYNTEVDGYNRESRYTGKVAGQNIFNNTLGVCRHLSKKILSVWLDDKTTGSKKYRDEHIQLLKELYIAPIPKDLNKEEKLKLRNSPERLQALKNQKNKVDSTFVLKNNLAPYYHPANYSDSELGKANAVYYSSKRNFDALIRNVIFKMIENRISIYYISVFTYDHCMAMSIEIKQKYFHIRFYDPNTKEGYVISDASIFYNFNLILEKTVYFYTQHKGINFVLNLVCYPGSFENFEAIQSKIVDKEEINIGECFNIAIVNCDRAIAVELLKDKYFLRKENLNIQYSNKRTSLHFAVEDGTLNIIRDLLIKGADPNIQDIKGNTPLYLASNKRNLDCVKELLKFKADPTILNIQGITALLNAAINRRWDIVSLMLDNMIAENKDYSEALRIEYLKEKGKDILSLATTAGKTEIVNKIKILLDKKNI